MLYPENLEPTAKENGRLRTMRSTQMLGLAVLASVLEEALRAKVLAMPHFGDNAPESNALARRVLDDIYEGTRDLMNERGGPFQLGLYIYREVIGWGRLTQATPDGRRSGDVLTQGLTPSRLHHAPEITSTINSGGALDLTQCPANSVLTPDHLPSSRRGQPADTGTA